MKQILTKAIDSLALVQSKRIRGKPSPWLSGEIKMVMNSRDKLLRKYRKTKLSTDFQAYKFLRNKVNHWQNTQNLNITSLCWRRTQIILTIFGIQLSKFTLINHLILCRLHSMTEQKGLRI